MGKPRRESTPARGIRIPAIVHDGAHTAFTVAFSIRAADDAAPWPARGAALSTQNGKPQRQAATRSRSIAKTIGAEPAPLSPDHSQDRRGCPMNDVDRSNRRQQPATRVDPITGAVIQGALENIAIEMGHKLMRMSYSSIIRESEDFGAALTDAEGRQLCECKMSTPLQSGPIPGYIRGVRARFAARGDVFYPGDVIMHNDPYAGASHGPDVAFCVPVFDDVELIGFSVTTAHHLD